ncbi:MAG: hypothetical protein RIK87_22310 [Fuerstiella sp.]
MYHSPPHEPAVASHGQIHHRSLPQRDFVLGQQLEEDGIAQHAFVVRFGADTQPVVDDGRDQMAIADGRAKDRPQPARDGSAVRDKTFRDNDAELDTVTQPDRLVQGLFELDPSVRERLEHSSA